MPLNPLLNPWISPLTTVTMTLVAVTTVTIQGHNVTFQSASLETILKCYYLM